MTRSARSNIGRLNMKTKTLGLWIFRISLVGLLWTGFAAVMIRKNYESFNKTVFDSKMDRYNKGELSEMPSDINNYEEWTKSDRENNGKVFWISCVSLVFGLTLWSVGSDMQKANSNRERLR